MVRRKSPCLLPSEARSVKACEKKAAGRNVCLKGLFQDRPELKRQVWEFLNELSPQAMLREGREQVIGVA